MDKQFYQEFKLGILGGGQLGRMFIQACTNFNVSSYVMDPDPNAPCKDLCSSFTEGSLKDHDRVYFFGKDKDLLTIEIENVNVDALYKLQKEGVKVFPQPEVLEIIQDKRKQKQFYAQHDIPTADFRLIENKQELEKHADFLPAFQKLGKDGYDGKGVQRITDTTDFEKAFTEPSLLEKLVDFEKELSVIVARNSKGEISSYPAVEQVIHPEYNLVDYLLSPAQINSEVEKEATRVAELVAEKLQIVGILAVELFLTKGGKVLVNEVAPRPHNSGHQTINASVTSQYEQHLRAILDLPLGNTATQIPSAMVNVLGEEGYQGIAYYEGIEKVVAVPGANLFLYGKKDTKPHRKMGHITIVDKDVEQLKGKVEEVKNVLRVITK
ncbi:MAG: 5-(carboxyamino)imidazole ribonucleotide synthase [Cyclobacteriaceae bacterium]